MKTLLPASPVLWSQRYEALRRHVVEQPRGAGDGERWAKDARS